MSQKYSFIEVPGIGYALDIDPLYFGFKGREDKPEVSIYLTKKENKHELEHIIKEESEKSTFNTIINGVGENSKFYPPSAAILLGVGSAPFMCPLHIFLAVFVGLPFFAMPRYLQKKSVEKMPNWLKNANWHESGLEKLQEYIKDQGIEEKIKNYSELKHELGFFQQIKTVFKEPENIKTKRLSLANDFEKVISLTDSIYNSAKEEQKYVINETKKVYNI